jgi:hypothetical protein
MIEQEIYEMFITFPRESKDLNILDVRRSGRSSDGEVYEMILKLMKDKVLVELYWLVERNVLYQEYVVIVDPKNLEWMGDAN